MRLEFYDSQTSDRGWSTAAEPAGAAAPESDRTMTQVAAEFGVSLRTLRFYESRGFLNPRRNGAARFYAKADRDRIALILRAKRLGFTLREIGTLIADNECAGNNGTLHLSRQQCTEQINFLERQKREIEDALTELRQEYSQHYLRELCRDPAGRH